MYINDKLQLQCYMLWQKAVCSTCYTAVKLYCYITICYITSYVTVHCYLLCCHAICYLLYYNVIGYLLLYVHCYLILYYLYLYLLHYIVICNFTVTVYVSAVLYTATYYSTLHNCQLSSVICYLLNYFNRKHYQKSCCKLSIKNQNLFFSNSLTFFVPVLLTVL